MANNDLSDWVPVDQTAIKNTNVSNQANSNIPADLSGWELVTTPTSKQQPPPPNETLGQAAARAPFRIGEDIYKGAGDFVKNIPGYYEKAKTEIPGALNLINPMNATSQRTLHALTQALAGTQEGINNIAQIPVNISRYGENRLNLIPHAVTQAIEKFSPEDTTQDINKIFGQPKYQGEELLRGLSRNMLNIPTGTEAASLLNPLNLTTKGIAKNVLKEEKKQVYKHNVAYNSLWKEADRTGFSEVPVDRHLLGSNYQVLNKFYPEKSTIALRAFLEEPTLEHAQGAQSDLGNLRRALEEKSKSGPLLESEKALYKVLSDSEKHIEQNMFKNSAGEINQPLQDQYRKVTNSYRENVVPYKYNKSIQDYKGRKISSEKLVNALNSGEFAVKKGWNHPALAIRNKVNQLLAGAGLVGGGALGGYLYNNAFGNGAER